MTPLKPKLSKRKDLRGRRIVAHRATLGPIQAEAPTPALALTALEMRVMAALARLDQGAKIIEQHGLTAVIWPDTEGWSSRVIGFQTGCHASQEFEKVEVGVRVHMAQLAWTPEVEDDHAFMDVVGYFPGKVRQRFRTVLESWIRFQRAYVQIKAEHPDWTSSQIHGATFNVQGALRAGV